MSSNRSSHRTCPWLELVIDNMLMLTIVPTPTGYEIQAMSDRRPVLSLPSRVSVHQLLKRIIRVAKRQGKRWRIVNPCV